MKTPLTRPATTDGLFVWVLHRFAEAFEEHAIVKGGIALRLLDCPRATNDIDFVFVPFTSKNEIAPKITSILSEIDGADVAVSMHSKMIRARLTVDGASIQIEGNVDIECPSTAQPTGSFARSQGQPSRIVRVMSLERALANTLATWNERRLVRDLYDVYYLAGRLGAVADRPALEARLSKIESRLPALRGRRIMTFAQHCEVLRRELDSLVDHRIRD